MSIETTIATIKEKYQQKKYYAVMDLCEPLYKKHLNNKQKLNEKNLFDVLFYMGHTLKFQKKYTQAQDIFNQMTEKLPERHQGYEGLVNIAQQQKDWQAVIEHSLNFQKKFPNMWQSYWWLGQAYKNISQFDKAEQQFQLLVENFPNQRQGYEGLVQIAQPKKDWQSIIKQAVPFQDKFPNIWQSYFWLGHAYKNLNQYDNAKQQFTLLIEKFPNQHQGYEGLVQIAQQQQDWKTTIELSLSFQNKFPNMWYSYWWLGQAYKNIIQYGNAKQQFTLLIEKFPNQHQGYEGLVQVAQHQQDWKTTIEQSLSFQEKFPNMWQSYWWLGQAYKNLSQYDNAKQQFALLIEKFPNQRQGFEGLVQIAQHQQDWQTTIQQSLSFQEKFPNMWQSYWWLGQAYKNLAQYKKARRAFFNLTIKFPKEPYGYQGFIDIANHRNDWRKLLQYSEDMCKALPDNINGYYQKGMALKYLKRFDEAEDYFIELAKQFPNHHQPLTGLADVYYTLRKWDKSISVLQKALLQFPTNQAITKQLINNYLIYNEPDDALDTFNKYITDHNNIANQLLLARIYQIKEGNEEYLDRLERLYNQYPNDTTIALTYANSLINLTLEEK